VSYLTTITCADLTTSQHGCSRQILNTVSGPFIDLNADLGEGSDVDIALLDLVSSANVATGGHAGGGQLMAATIEAAALRGVAVGAHPSYPDRSNFGRISLLDRLDPRSLWPAVTAQIVDVGRVCALVGSPIGHVKAHGALYYDVADRPDGAEAFLAAVQVACEELSLASLLAVVGPPDSHLASFAETCGFPFVAEGFIDRGYGSDARPIARIRPHALLDATAAAAQAVDLARDGRALDRVTGRQLPLSVRTLCVHSDTVDAVAIAIAAREALGSAGIRIRSASTP
jgi:UPF0271 protein